MQKVKGEQFSFYKKQKLVVDEPMNKKFLMPPNLFIHKQPINNQENINNYNSIRAVQNNMSSPGLVDDNIQNLKTIQFQNSEGKIISLPILSKFSESNKEFVNTETNADSEEKILELSEDIDLESIDDNLHNENLENNKHQCCHVFKIVKEQSKSIKILTDQVLQLKGIVNMLFEVVANKTNGEVGAKRPSFTLLPQFPFKSIEDFESFDRLLQDSEEVRQQFKKYLLSLGGKNPEKIVRRALSNTVSDELGCMFNWTGTRGAKKMGNKTFATVFLNTFNNAKGATKHDIEEVFKDWLRRSSDRKTNQMKKKEVADARIMQE